MLNTTVTPVLLQTLHEKQQKLVKSLKAKIYQEESSVVQSLHLLHDIDSEFFNYEWTKYPASLFEPDDQGYDVNKGNEADYVEALKSQLGDSWLEEDQLPFADGSVLLMPMAFIHRQQDIGCKKFLNMATRSLHKLLMSRLPGCNMVNLVGDWYGVQLSLKEPERVRRQQTQDDVSRTFEIQDNLSIPTWKSFITNAKNKAALQRYRAKMWCKHPEMVPRDVQLLEASPMNLSSFKEMITNPTRFVV